MALVWFLFSRTENEEEEVFHHVVFPPGEGRGMDELGNEDQE